MFWINKNSTWPLSLWIGGNKPRLHAINRSPNSISRVFWGSLRGKQAFILTMFNRDLMGVGGKYCTFSLGAGREGPREIGSGHLEQIQSFFRPVQWFKWQKTTRRHGFCKWHRSIERPLIWFMLFHVRIDYWDMRKWRSPIWVPSGFFIGQIFWQILQKGLLKAWFFWLKILFCA